MTKKILHTVGDKGEKKEFIIPIELESKFQLVGIESGKFYESGMMVFTGVELSPKLIKEKATNSGLVISESLLGDYLAQIPSFKISKMVRIKNVGSLVLEYV